VAPWKAPKQVRGHLLLEVKSLRTAHTTCLQVCLVLLEWRLFLRFTSVTSRFFELPSNQPRSQRTSLRLTFCFRLSRLTGDVKRRNTPLTMFSLLRITSILLHILAFRRLWSNLLVHEQTKDKDDTHRFSWSDGVPEPDEGAHDGEHLV